MKHMTKKARVIAACVAAVGIVGAFPLSSTAAGAINPALSLRMSGDVDENGRIDTTDARRILQYAAGRAVSGFSVNAADYDDNRKINTTDARLTLQFAAGRTTKAPYPLSEPTGHSQTPLAGTAAPFVCAELIPNTFGGYDSGSHVLVAQTAEEWAMLKAAYNLSGSYDDAFFADRLLIVANVFLSTTNSTLEINGVTVSGNTVQVVGTVYRPNPDTAGIARGRAVLEVSRAALNGVTQTSLYTKGVIVDR